MFCFLFSSMKANGEGISLGWNGYEAYASFFNTHGTNLYIIFFIGQRLKPFPPILYTIFCICQRLKIFFTNSLASEFILIFL